MSEQAINFVFSILSPSVATRSKNTPELRSNQILQVVKPFYLSDESMSYCRLNDQYLFTIHIDWFGSDYLEDLSLWPILTLPYDYDLSLHLIPLNKDLVLDQITKKIYSVEHNTAERQEKKALYEAERIEEKGSEEINGLSLLKANLTDRTTNLWSGSIDITFRAGSHKEMMEIKEVLTRKAGVNKILYSESTGHHIEGFISTLPLLQNHLAGYNRPYKRWEKLSQEVCHFYPYCPSAVQSKKGAILGLSVQ